MASDLWTELKRKPLAGRSPILSLSPLLRSRGQPLPAKRPAKVAYTVLIGP